MQISLPEFIVFASTLCGSVGLALMIAAIRCSGSGWQRCYQRLFTACLVCLGGATIVAVAHQDSSWICAAVAFAVLAVGATCESRSAESFSVA